MEQNYNIRAAAQLLGVPVRTIRYWIHKGVIKAVQYTNRGKWYISGSEINRIMSGK